MAEEEVPNHSNYMLKADIIEALNNHVKNFDWRGEQCVLDVNCGLGEITESILLPLLPPHATLVGWDDSKEMIQYCQKFRKNPRISFHQVDIQYVDLFFSWKWDYFNKIFSFYSSRWMQSCRRSLCNMHSLLKDNGEVMLIFLTPDNPMFRAFEMLKQRPLYNRLFSNRSWFYASREPVHFLRTLLDDIGYTNIYCYQKATSTTYPSWDTYMELISAINPYLPGLPNHQINDCLTSIRQFLKRDSQISEDRTTGEITVQYGLVIGVAKKKKKKQPEGE